MSVWDGAAEISLDGAKQRTVLAALLLSSGHVLSDDRLTELLWGENPPKTVNAQIHTYVSRLRKYLGDQVDLVRKRPGYLLRDNGVASDVSKFRAHASAGTQALERGEAKFATAELQAALGCWRGPALAGVTEFLRAAEGVRLEEERVAALENLVEAELTLGRHERLVSELTGLVTDHPLRERSRAQLMVALFRCDRQADALAVFEDGRRILAGELGVDPGPLLRQAQQDVLTGKAALRQVAPVTATPVPPAMLPADVPELAGRDPQLRQLRDLLRTSPGETGHRRAVALVRGMPGCGKTALAVRAAHDAHEDFPDGQLFVDLGGDSGVPREPAEVLRWFLSALGATSAQVPESLSERVNLYRSLIGDRRILVLLDNAAGWQQVRPLLPGGRNCRVVITSRSAPVTAEVGCVLDLGPLDAESALALFTDVVGEARVAAEQVAARRITELCGRLPMAVRIAAARLVDKPHWPISVLAGRLESTHSRLAELCTGDMDIRTSLAGSYARLPRDARRGLVRLSVLETQEFPARVAAAALNEPVAEVEELLESLVDARMTEAVSVDATGCVHYRFHPLVRAFAQERHLVGQLTTPRAARGLYPAPAAV
ncbi:BTAD domain-containing putative transcriptional regulator [Lentzea sp. NPDC054927]